MSMRTGFCMAASTSDPTEGGYRHLPGHSSDYQQHQRLSSHRWCCAHHTWPTWHGQTHCGWQGYGTDSCVQRSTPEESLWFWTFYTHLMHITDNKKTRLFWSNYIYKRSTGTLFIQTVWNGCKLTRKILFFKPQTFHRQWRRWILWQYQLECLE